VALWDLPFSLKGTKHTKKHFVKNEVMGYAFNVYAGKKKLKITVNIFKTESFNVSNV
jgi:hypothetical protein